MISARNLLKLAPLCLQVRHGSRMFPQLKRGQFSRLTDEDINYFTGVVGENGVRWKSILFYDRQKSFLLRFHRVISRFAVSSCKVQAPNLHSIYFKLRYKHHTSKKVALSTKQPRLKQKTWITTTQTGWTLSPVIPRLWLVLKQLSKSLLSWVTATTGDSLSYPKVSYYYSYF